MKTLLERHFDTALDAPDGIKRLRELILTLAMQGKLVKQDPNDPPASELLKGIEAEKKRLIKAGKIKQPNPFPPIKTEEFPYALPKGWEWVRLGEIAENIRGITYAKSQANDSQSKGNIELLRANNINESINFINTVFVPSILVKDTQRLQYGDILIAMSSGSPHLVGKAAQFLANRECTFGAFCGVIRSYSAAIMVYLEKYCRSPLYRGQTLDHGKGIGIQNLKIESLQNLFLPLPPLPEQHRIVAKIDQLMARCDALEKLRAERDQKRLVVHAAAIRQLLDTSSLPSRPQHVQHFLFSHFPELYAVKENVTELRKAILQLAVMGKLVPQDPKDPPASELLKEIEAEKKRLLKAGKIKQSKPLPPIKPEEIPYELPKGWEWVRLGTIAEFINGDRGKNYPNRVEYVSQGIPWINTGHIEPDGTLTKCDMNFITRKKFDSLNSGKIESGDLVYCLRGATFGKTAIVDPYKEGAIASSLMIIRPFSLVLNRYVYRYLISALGRSQIFRFDNGSAQPNLSANNVRLYVYPLPPLAEQHRIVAKIDQLMALCDAMENQITSATAKQTTLLTTLMARV